MANERSVLGEFLLFPLCRCRVLCDGDGFLILPWQKTTPQGTAIIRWCDSSRSFTDSSIPTLSSGISSRLAKDCEVAYTSAILDESCTVERAEKESGWRWPTINLGRLITSGGLRRFHMAGCRPQQSKDLDQ